MTTPTIELYYGCSSLALIKIAKLHHFNPLMETEQEHLTHAQKTQSRAELSVVSDILLQRETELHILPNEPEQHFDKPGLGFILICNRKGRSSEEEYEVGKKIEGERKLEEESS
ncbi:hypothetical protein HA466_0250390 [Hirschfeldia incana]|nr:hypothetical protein HA466_0250390 [Hirschfeldia incana]